MTGHGPASMTVTGTWLPSSANTCVIPTFRPISPSLRAIVTPHPEGYAPSICSSRPIKTVPDARRRRATTEAYAAYAGRSEEATKQMGGFHRPLKLDFYVDAGGQVELHQRVNRLRRGIHDVQQPLVRPHLERLP